MKKEKEERQINHSKQTKMNAAKIKRQIFEEDFLAGMADMLQAA